ncbi:unnamed protein product [Litomosoides sigmodontis]|uniref:Uncharacterized protein n=1 Tax=Litomosoides sigmodontis TaxID=42156 RepID=A0A3P7MAI2_LITSI|nr:unnamed protein product [Litomosoides sigmodontis]
MFNRSVETDAWMSQIQASECSRAVQTAFDDEVHEVYALSSKGKKQIGSINSFSIENSTQCSFETKDTCDTLVQTMLDMNNFNLENSTDGECNASNASVHQRTDDASESAPKWIKPKRQDLVIQTDDSYLKIARRLDQIRTNRTESLHICMAKPLKKTERRNSSKRRLENSDGRRGHYLRVASMRRKNENEAANDEQILPSVSVTKIMNAEGDDDRLHFSLLSKNDNVS